MPRADFRFAHRMRVRYAEVDPQRIVFNTRYLEYFDVGITEYFRTVGLRDSEEGGAEFHVARNTIDYKKPLRAGTRCSTCCLRCDAHRHFSSMTYEWEIHGLADGEEAGRSARPRYLGFGSCWPTWPRPLTRAAGDRGGVRERSRGRTAETARKAA